MYLILMTYWQQTGFRLITLSSSVRIWRRTETLYCFSELLKYLSFFAMIVFLILIHMRPSKGITEFVSFNSIEEVAFSFNGGKDSTVCSQYFFSLEFLKILLVFDFSFNIFFIRLCRFYCICSELVIFCIKLNKIIAMGISMIMNSCFQS